MHGQHLVDVLDLRLAGGDVADAGDHLWVGTFTDEQALGFVGQPHRGRAENETDDDGCHPVEVQDPGRVREEDAQEGNHQAEHRGRILEEHDEKRRVLGLANGLKVWLESPVLVELFPGQKPRASLEEHGQTEDDVVDVRALDRFGMEHVSHALVNGNSGTDGEDQDRHHEAPEVELLAVAERELGVGRFLRSLQSVQEQDLITGVDHRVDPLGEHGRAPRHRGGRELGDRNQAVADQCSNDDFLGGTGHHILIIVVAVALPTSSC